MKLNPDCLRDVLISVEEHTGYKIKVYYPSKKMNKLRDKYSDLEIRYHIVQASKAELIEPIHIDDNENIYIDDLTPKGHEFLANIRSDTVWNKTKDVLSVVGSASIPVLANVAEKVLLSIIGLK